MIVARGFRFRVAWGQVNFVAVSFSSCLAGHSLDSWNDFEAAPWAVDDDRELFVSMTHIKTSTLWLPPALQVRGKC